MAAAIPLRCNLCPKEPEFSDLSHLLTHVSSKGHLAHHLKAQLRGHDEWAFRQKLEVYNEWYAKNNIQQLLSQRLSAKGFKKSSEKQRIKSTKPTKPTRRSKARKSRTRTPTSPLLRQSSPKKEAAIDPQLSDVHLQFQYALDIPSHPSQIVESDRSQPFVPRMSAWQADSCGGPKQISNAAAESDHEMDADEGYFKSFIASPVSAEYPDLPEWPKQASWNQPVKDDESFTELQASRAHYLPHVDGRDHDQNGMNIFNSPILKGVKWPGMSLFDSASLDAQRQRNQRKDRSIIDQMVQNSMSVEQMEDIYWPDGSLKKRRMITGNVDSSPTSQSTPLPKIPRRARHEKPRSVLTELSTNGPRMPKKRGRKSKNVQTSALLGDDRDQMHAHSTQSDSLPHGPHYSIASMTALEKHISGGSPTHRPHRRAFRVFKDVQRQDTEKNRDGVDEKPMAHVNHLLPFTTSLQPDESGSDGKVGPFGLYNTIHSSPKAHKPSEDAENVAPSFNSLVQGEHLHKPLKRVTQRYFSVTGTEEPVFYDTMPPQMDFGGMTGPRYRGATLNPLNPLNPYFRGLSRQPPGLLASSANSLSLSDGNQHRSRHVSSGMPSERETSKSDKA